MFLRKIRSNTKPNKREHQFISKTQLIEYLPPRFQIKTSFLLSEVSACVAHLFVSNGGNSLLLFLLAVGCWLLAADDFSTASASATCQLSKISQSKDIQQNREGQKTTTTVNGRAPHVPLYLFKNIFYLFS